MKQIRPIKLTDTMTGKRLPLETRTPGKLTMYSCGPTVYGFVHIGNLRGALVSDLFFRYFKRVGYDVAYVRNFTDVDDKIIKRANEEGISANDVAEKYIREVEQDFAKAGVAEPTYKTRVTTHMPEIISLIERIIANGKGYVVEGEVLFSIDSFKGYGKLSHKPLDDLIAGIRVDVNQKKKNPLDFTLWKPAKPGEPSWDSPWGKGRPGWHIECSAMSSRWLGDQIDIHHGGEDLIFPHHENEIAQSEGASGKDPFVKYWLHHAFLTLSKEKMSKSIGNVFTARDFLSQFNGEVARYLLLSVHYRSPIDFNEETVEQALTGLHRIYEAKAKAAQFAGSHAAKTASGKGVWAPFFGSVEEAKKQIDESYANDFNTAGALGELYTLIRTFNRILAEPGAEKDPDCAVAASKLIEVMEDDIGGVLGVGVADSTLMLKDIERIRASRPAEGGASRPSGEEIQKLIQARADARKAKNFAEADRIRKDLDARGVVIKDSPTGTTWSYK